MLNKKVYVFMAVILLGLALWSAANKMWTIALMEVVIAAIFWHQLLNYPSDESVKRLEYVKHLPNPPSKVVRQYRLKHPELSLTDAIADLKGAPPLKDGKFVPPSPKKKTQG
ncbi:hypothetical protein [Actinomyces vulturis]|uniref:hypothetical protein n=1 Tax=Actinomyces vulturis TaxID=1857645 RepID=UPI001146F353|nr:hypothetical protein [Actinomyces vulturis]